MRIETKLGLGAFGEFSHRVKNPRLPSIESYVLEDTRGKISSIKDWLKTEGRWLYLHGFQTTGFCAATNGQCVFTPPDWFVREDRSSARIIAFKQFCRENTSEAIGSAIDSIVPAFALVSWAEAVIEHLESVRSKMFALLRTKRTRKLTDYIEFSESVQQKAMALERVQNESGADFISLWRSRDEDRFHLLRQTTAEQTEFSATMRDSFRQVTQTLRDESSRMSRSFSDFVSARNMAASYRLQRAVLLLTIITVVVNGAPIFAWIKKIVPLVRDFFPAFH